MSISRCFFPVLTLALLVLNGCGASQLDRADVEGEVTLDGKALVLGDITFEPTDPAVQSDNIRIVDGKFSGQVIPGEKLVRIRGFEIVTPDVPADSPEAGVSFNKQFLPEKFNVESDLTATIPSEGLLKFDLTN